MAVGLKCKFKEQLTDGDGNLIFTFVAGRDERGDAIKCLQKIRTWQKNDLQVLKMELSLYKEQRSLSANAYFHLLVNKIAKKMDIGMEECKRQMVLDYGTIARDSEGAKVGIKLLKSVNVYDFYDYAQKFDERVEGGKTFYCYIFYKRTHLLDQAEMTRLIKGVVYEAQQLGIETRTPDELAQMLSLWEAGSEKQTN